VSVEELVATVRSLPRGDKLRLVHVLIDDLARPEESNLLEAGKDYPVWTPLNAEAAAAVLARLLEEPEVK
jgi:hypothetical protein